MTKFEENNSEQLKEFLLKLLINKDSTSVVKPVVAIDKFKYQLAFENALAIHPDSLVNQIKEGKQKKAVGEILKVYQLKRK